MSNRLETTTTLGAAAAPVISRWSYWRNALKGQFGELTVGVPECGYYRHLQRDGTYTPVGVWWDEDRGEIVAQIGGRSVVPDAEWCERIFARACRNPVTFAAYKDAVEGKPWPDAAPEKPKSNLPVDPHEAIVVELEGEAEAVERLLATPLGVADKDRAGSATALADRIAGIGKRAEALRVTEKKPHDDAAKAVQTKWKPQVDKAASLVSRLKEAIGAHLRAAQREAEEARRAAEAEAAELRRQAAIQDKEERERMLAQAEKAEQQAAAPIQTKIAGAEGRTVALRTVKSARIVDYDDALLALRHHPEMKELVQQLANRAARAGIPLDGVEIVEEQRAA